MVSPLSPLATPLRSAICAQVNESMQIVNSASFISRFRPLNFRISFLSATIDKKMRCQASDKPFQLVPPPPVLKKVYQVTKICFLKTYFNLHSRYIGIVCELLTVNTIELLDFSQSRNR